MSIVETLIGAVAAVAVAQIIGRALMSAGKAVEASAAVAKDAAWLIADAEQRAQIECDDDVDEPQPTLKSRYEVVGDNVFAIKPKVK
jgi:hypothetical protein